MSINHNELNGYYSTNKNKFDTLPNPENPVELITYVDSDHAGDCDTLKSTTGYIFMLAGGPISWQSKLQDCISLSSMESEYIAACAATQESIWLSSLIEELNVNIKKPITINEDNKACIQYSKHPGDHRRTKHNDNKYHFVREQVNEGKVELNYCPSVDNIADIFTKALPPQKFEKFRNLIVNKVI
jgi:hypothetical protein